MPSVQILRRTASSVANVCAVADVDVRVSARATIAKRRIWDSGGLRLGSSQIFSAKQTQIGVDAQRSTPTSYGQRMAVRTAALMPFASAANLRVRVVKKSDGR